jgi:hypothetical protein
MKLEQWTLVIDMMGYGVINGRIKTEEEAKEFITFMKKNVELITQQDNDEVKKMYAKTSFNLYEYYDIKIIFVSDSIMVSYYPKEVSSLTLENERILHSANALFIILQRLQIFMYHCMNEKKIMVRGGISNKFSLIEDSFAVGEGIIEAYILESKIAVHPRVILSKDIMKHETLIKAIRLLSKALYNIDSILETDENGVYYLDYLGYNIRQALQGSFNLLNLASYQAFFLTHKETIEFHYGATLDAIERLKKTAPADEKGLKKLMEVLEKYIWLKVYHNRKMETFKNKELEERFLIP